MCSTARSGPTNRCAHIRCPAIAAVAVHPNGGEVEGSPVYTSIGQVPERLDRITLYLRPSLALAALDEIAEKGCGELWLNPGVDSPEVIDRAESLGLSVRTGCSIIDVGVSPGSL